MTKIIWSFIFVVLSVPSQALEVAQNASSKNSLDTKHAMSLSFDNDLFVPSRSDKDYTAGFALTYHGELPTPLNTFFDQSLALIDQHSMKLASTSVAARLSQGVLSQRFEFGSYGFTPEDIESNVLDTSDRPYASLVYLSTSNTYPAANQGDSWTSALTIGLLGSNFFEQGQAAVHGVLNGDDARGWRRQISDGGELTARYQLAYHQSLEAPLALDQAKLTYFGSIGYLSEAGAALSVREGLISSPDYRFNPALTNYGEGANAIASEPRGEESYFWGGVGIKLRAYNAFLQGQFRASAHTFSADQLSIALLEAWAGYTKSIFSGTKLSYMVRAQSSEIRRGTGARGLMWGGFVLSHALATR